MFTQFGATADSLSKASTMVFRIGTDAHLYDDPDDVSIIPLLDSKFDSEKCEALKRLLALIAQGIDVSNYFPQVVKNVATQSLEVKKLVYVYLLHYAEKRPNEALLSINYFQKDLGDTNPLVRAWALRTMAGIRLHVIAPLVIAAVNKCARDPSVYVRKCAANALPKLNDLRQEENVSAVEEIIGILLNDHSPSVIGAAAAAFSSICPNKLRLIAKSYRKLCETLPDVEEWGQIILIGILLRFVIASHGLAKESVLFAPSNRFETGDSNGDVVEASELVHGQSKSELADLVARSYTEGPDEYLTRSSTRKGMFWDFDDASFTQGEANDDVRILLKSTSPLLWSQNSAVVLAAVGVHWIMAPKDALNKIVKPLLFLLRSSNASKYVVLCNIQIFAKVMPSLFSDYYEDFLISTSETYPIKALKLEVLSLIATELSIPCIFQEFEDYIKDPDRRFAADTVAAIGLCAQRLAKFADLCLESLLSLVKMESVTGETNVVDEEAGVLIQAVMSIKAIINQDPLSHDKVIIQLARSLDAVKVPAARAIIIWMVGEYNSIGERIPLMLTVLLKYLAYCFTSESPETKLQILNTSVKISFSAKGDDRTTVKRIVSFIFELAKCDMNYDVRDRARALSKILPGLLDTDIHGLISDSVKEEATKLIAQKIFVPSKGSPSSPPLSSRFYLPGSLSQVVLHAAPGYEPLPKPCSLPLADGGQDSFLGTEISNGSERTDDSETLSGSEEGDSDYSSDHDSNASYNSKQIESVSDADDSGPLIQIGDAENALERQDGDADNSNIHYGSGGMEDVMSKSALESWLVEQPIGLDGDLKSSTGDNVQRSARISIGDLGSQAKPKTYVLLDTASSQGLKVEYTFSSQISNISPLLICVEVSFHNSSNQPLSKVSLVDEGSSRGANLSDQASVTTERSTPSEDDVPTLVPMEEIDTLGPGYMERRILHVRFHHHLLPLKLSLWCNGKKYSVKLRPDIGYFIKPLEMDVLAFRNKESQLPGMFEYVRRCTYADHIAELNKDASDNTKTKDSILLICASIVLKMLSNAKLFLVSADFPLSSKLDDASGLCLRFSSEILSTSAPCLISITVEGNCSEPLSVCVKVNCEETVFGLNLLNRIVNFLVE